MPYYDYICDKCGKTVEAFHRMGHAPAKARCSCEGTLKRTYGGQRLNLNNWRPNPLEMNGEKEATAAGVYE